MEVDRIPQIIERTSCIKIIFVYIFFQWAANNIWCLGSLLNHRHDTADPEECAIQDAQIASTTSPNGKAEATPPIADDSFCQSHFSHFYYLFIFILIILLLLFCDVEVLHWLWCRLLSQSAQVIFFFCFVFLFEWNWSSLQSSNFCFLEIWFCCCCRMFGTLCINNNKIILVHTSWNSLAPYATFLHFRSCL